MCVSGNALGGSVLKMFEFYSTAAGFVLPLARIDTRGYFIDAPI
jgi:hypothetical protein